MATFDAASPSAQALCDQSSTPHTRRTHMERLFALTDQNDNRLSATPSLVDDGHLLLCVNARSVRLSLDDQRALLRFLATGLGVDTPETKEEAKARLQAAYKTAVRARAAAYETAARAQDAADEASVRARDAVDLAYEAYVAAAVAFRAAAAEADKLTSEATKLGVDLGHIDY